jgi:IMP dehydrogenase
MSAAAPRLFCCGLLAPGSAGCSVKLFSLEGLELGRVEVERLLALEDKFAREGLAFDDVLLVPASSEVLPNDVSTRTRLTRELELAIPVVSAAMDTVTEARLAISLARAGGIGIVHRNLSIEDQVVEVDKVKRSEAGMIVEPVTLPPDAPVAEALALMSRYRISGVPITDDEGILVGILTNRDLRFETDTAQPVSALMTGRDLVTAPVGTTLDEAERILHRNKVEKLPVVDADGRLRGLITVKDISKRIEYPDATKDEQGRLRVGAAIGVGSDALERAQALAAAGADVLVLDTAHGHSRGVLEMARRIRSQLDTQLVAGNVATAEAAEALIAEGVDGVKVGIGPGATCTTRVVAGVGVPQVTAVFDCARVCSAEGVPLVADGGIRNSGDIAKAIAAGADSVMLGSVLAGTDEAPGDVILVQGERYKEYRGMGSLGAMKARSFSKDRYFQGDVEDVDKLVPEGIEGRVPYKGAVQAVLYQLVGGLRQSMGYCGAGAIDEMKERTRFVRISAAGLQESHPHDMTITKEAPNYRR